MEQQSYKLVLQPNLPGQIFPRITGATQELCLASFSTGTLDFQFRYMLDMICDHC